MVRFRGERQCQRIKCDKKKSKYITKIKQKTENTNKYIIYKYYWQTDPTFWFFKANETSSNTIFNFLPNYYYKLLLKTISHKILLNLS